MLKVKDGTKTAGIHLKVDETGNITTVDTYPYTGMNRPPILVKVHEPLSTTAEQSVSGNVGLYFVDLENDEIKYTIRTGVSYGSLLLNTVSGVFTYKPDYNTIVQNDTFTISAYDTSMGSSIIKVDIIIMF
ncbi:Ig-like domain-containing protein [Lysinibacillus sp. LZ02]|uniref:Ig-like domain-containing protein n=1 Tax=Lysinibacillus sp. LZ02 TaxID=3420668 RepID=UPI003D35F1DF